MTSKNVTLSGSAPGVTSQRQDSEGSRYTVGRRHRARIHDLATPLAEPEEESRVFIVAQK